MSTARERASGGGLAGGIFASMAWLLPWLLLVNHLRVFWTLAPDYEYGWAVLPLIVYFVFRRWTSSSATNIHSQGAAFVAMASAFLILPVWWVCIAVPDWSLINYTLAALVIFYTLALTARQTSWLAARNLLFPLAFILCAVPWPQRAENAVIQALTQGVAALSVEALQWLGIGAVRQGNLVSLGIGTIGISDACSGIRSLQAMLVAGLTIGEIYWLTVPRRLALLAISFALALALNLLRNITLVWIAYRHGIAALEQMHDPAGWLILLISLPPIFLLARRWRTVREELTEGIWVRIRPLPLGAAAALAAWFCLVIAGVEAWYRVHEQGATKGTRLQIHWPAGEKGFRTGALDDRTRDLLLCSSAQIGTWLDSSNARWQLSAMNWEPGKTSAQSARVHRPEVCFQASGAEFVADMPAETIPISGGAIRFEPMEFRRESGPVFLFYYLHEGSNRDDLRDYFQTRADRLQHALRGQRNLGQQAIELSASGFQDYPSALEALKKMAPSLFSFELSVSK